MIDESIEQRLRSTGIRHVDAEALANELEAKGLPESSKAATEEELEAARERESELNGQLERCRNVLERSRKHVEFDSGQFRDALSCALELLGAEPLRAATREDGERVWEVPPLDRRAATDPSWTRTLDSLRTPRKREQKIGEWRKTAPIRPVVFKDRGVLSDEDRASPLGAADGPATACPVSITGIRPTTTCLELASLTPRTLCGEWSCWDDCFSSGAGRSASTRSLFLSPHAGASQRNVTAP